MDTQQLTDAEIDQIIVEVEQTLNKAEDLTKSKKEGTLNKAIPPKEEPEAPAPPQEEPAAPPPEAGSPEAPPPEDGSAPPEQESAPAASEAPAEEPPMDGQAPAGGEEALSEDAPLTDEELEQIYGSMAPEELERHYMVIRQHMQAAYAQQDPGQQPAPEAPAPEQAPPPEQPMAMSEKAQNDLNKSEFDSLKAENVKMKAETESIKKSLDLMAKALEVGFTPKRKSVEGLEFIKKSEADNPDAQPLSKSEIKSQINALYSDNSKVSSLSKSDRDAIDSYLLDGSGKETVEKILNLGGKK